LERDGEGATVVALVKAVFIETSDIVADRVRIKFSILREKNNDFEDNI
jgi:hypothetical protein